MKHFATQQVFHREQGHNTREKGKKGTWVRRPPSAISAYRIITSPYCRVQVGDQLLPGITINSRLGITAQPIKKEG